MGNVTLITGITGQDGSYMADLLVAKGHEVHGIVRRHAAPSHPNIQHLLDKAAVRLHEADLADLRSLESVVEKVRPDFVVGLGAQSHVGTSYAQPEYTLNVTGLGAMRVFEAVRRHAPRARVYQASSSEMFGNTLSDVPAWRDHGSLNEIACFAPVSQYGDAKVLAHHLAHTYRQAYGMHISCGILFNHECFVPETPVIIRRAGLIDILPISETMPNYAHAPQRALDFDVWDKGGWTRTTLGTANWNGRQNDRGAVRLIARCGELAVTNDHRIITENGETIPAVAAKAGMSLSTCALPGPPGLTRISAEWSEFLGLMAAEGWASRKDGKYVATFRNNDKVLIERVQHLWQTLTGGGVADNPGVSGFTGTETLGLRLMGAPGIAHWLADMLYTGDGSKRVPVVVLNAGAEAWRSFLHGYNLGDGLKAGSGTHEFKNFKTSDATLAAGLWVLASILNQKLTLNLDFVTRGTEEYHYYSINLGVPGGSPKGRHLLRHGPELKQTRPLVHEGWVFDLATETGTLHAGVGNLVVHNSERRGPLFVTRKISQAVARVKYGLQDKLELGNMTAVRDWGYAPEYMEAAWRMLQRDQPGDYVIATREGHTVDEFLERALVEARLTGRPAMSVSVNQDVRPTDIQRLVGDATRAKEVLKWTPKTRFIELVGLMVAHDLKLAKEEADARKA